MANSRHVAQHSNAPIIVEPPLVLALMSLEARSRSVMLFGLTAEKLAIDSWRVLVNVVFQPIRIRRGALAPVDYYVATTGGHIELSAPEAEVLDFTGPSGMKVDYELGAQRKAEIDRKLAPELTSKAGGLDLQLKGVTSEHSRQDVLSSGAKFSSTEMLLTATNCENAVTWQIDSHRGDKIIRDFLVGNVYLDAVFRWRGLTKKGIARVCPSEIAFFDGGRRRLSKRASILMRFALWRKGIDVAYHNGITVEFIEDQHARS
jgi:hypothetical protein